jgi:hypothetical protein
MYVDSLLAFMLFLFLCLLLLAGIPFSLDLIGSHLIFWRCANAYTASGPCRRPCVASAYRHEPYCALGAGGGAAAAG